MTNDDQVRIHRIERARCPQGLPLAADEPEAEKLITSAPMRLFATKPTCGCCFRRTR